MNGPTIACRAMSLWCIIWSGTGWFGPCLESEKLQAMVKNHSYNKYLIQTALILFLPDKYLNVSRLG
jgi:hypothetical protein